jgi:hypothetical protein
MSNKKLSDEEENDLMLMFEDRVIYGFDYLHAKSKLLMIEVNPVTIFYSNAIMSYGSMPRYKDLLINESKDVLNWSTEKSPPNLFHMSMYFQLAINCVINLQATLESFANRVIPENYPYLNIHGEPIPDTIAYKLNVAIPKVKNDIGFENRKYKKIRIAVEALIKLRNDIIHLKPLSETNTAYKNVYRELLKFDYIKTITSVKTLINYYEPNLIEECECGQDFSFYSGLTDSV